MSQQFVLFVFFLATLFTLVTPFVESLSNTPISKVIEKAAAAKKSVGKSGSQSGSPVKSRLGVLKSVGVAVYEKGEAVNDNDNDNVRVEADESVVDGALVAKSRENSNGKDEAKRSDLDTGKDSKDIADSEVTDSERLDSGDVESKVAESKYMELIRADAEAEKADKEKVEADASEKDAKPQIKEEKKNVRHKRKVVRGKHNTYDLALYLGAGLAAIVFYVSFMFAGIYLFLRQKKRSQERDALSKTEAHRSNYDHLSHDDDATHSVSDKLVKGRGGALALGKPPYRRMAPVPTH